VPEQIDSAATRRYNSVTTTTTTRPTMDTTTAASVSGGGSSNFCCASGLCHSCSDRRRHTDCVVPSKNTEISVFVQS